MRINYGYFEEEKLGKPYDIKLMMRLFPFVLPYLRFFSISIFLIILITLLNLSIPYLTKIAIDRYIVPELAPMTKLESEITSKANPASSKSGNTRYMEFDFLKNEVQTVVKKYPLLFQLEDNRAKILFSDLMKLEKEDIVSIRSNDLSGITTIALLFILVIGLNFIFNFLQIMVMENMGQHITHDMRIALFSHIQSLSMSFFTRNSVGRLVTRVTNDVQNMHELFSSVLVFLFKDIFLCAGIACVLIAINFKLAMICFAILPFVAVASIFFSTRARDVFRQLRVKVAQINTRFSESIGGIKVIQLFLQEKNNYERFAELNHENYQAGMRQIKIFAIFMPVIEFLGVISIAIIIYFGGRGVLGEVISLGSLVAFISYMKMLFRPIRDIAEKYNIMQNAMASAERIFLILDTDDKIPVHEKADGFFPGEKFCDLEFEKISFSYVPDETILNDVSFSIKAGQTIAIVGPTGSGKTTLINLVIRFYDPSRGRVMINGCDLRLVDPSILRSKMAIVAQDPFLFSSTVKENIFQGISDLSEEKIDYVLDAANCRFVVERLPYGLDTNLSEGGLSISSGERQLISIARAFAHDPELIIFDEATSYIDSGTEAAIQEAMTNLMNEKTAIIVAHRLSTARNADMIIVLDKGKIIESGTHSNLMKKQGFYYQLHQFRKIL